MIGTESSSVNSTKDLSYYSFVKRWMLDWLPRSPCAVLDIGCAAGAMGKAIREENLPVDLTGVELSAEAAKCAVSYYSRIHEGDVEQMDLPYADHFDVIICADILEHLRDPWKMLQRIRAMLKPDGLLLCSIPNIRYWRILRDLALRGSWKYVDAGILDNTHLRFFTRKSFSDDLTHAGFAVQHCSISIHGAKQSLADRISMGVFSEFLGSQIRFVARRQMGYS